MNPATLADAQGVADPLDRARAAADLIAEYDRSRAEACRIRDDAIRTLADDRNMTSPEIADLLAPKTSLGVVKAARSARKRAAGGGAGR